MIRDAYPFSMSSIVPRYLFSAFLRPSSSKYSLSSQAPDTVVPTFLLTVPEIGHGGLVEMIGIPIPRLFPKVESGLVFRYR